MEHGALLLAHMAGSVLGMRAKGVGFEVGISGPKRPWSELERRALLIGVRLGLKI